MISMKYIGTKIINAQPMTLWEYHKLHGAKFLEADADPDGPGYLVEYTDGGKPNHPDYKGYISWSPKDVFEKSYHHLSELDFSMALSLMKAGHKVARGNWLCGEYLMIIDCDGKPALSKFGPSSNSTGMPTLISNENMMATDWGVVE